MKESTLLRVPVALGTREELLGKVLSLLECGGTVATVNATMLEYAYTHTAFHRTLCEMSLCIPDGKGVSLAFCGRDEKTDTLPGVELGLLVPASRQNLRIALYGGKGDVASRAGEYLLSISPTSEIVYSRDGYHHTPFEVCKDLATLSPDLVYIALGSPKQEEVTRLLSAILPNALIIALGGSFDVWCGDKARAPKKMQSLGLEWLWRMMKEPRRFTKIPTLIAFSYHAFLENMHTKSTKTKEKSQGVRKF